MLKSIYDKDNDNVIDKAKTAEDANNLGGKDLETIEKEADNKFIAKNNKLPRNTDLNDIREA